MRPSLITFDIFGTVVDWRRGLLDAIRAEGHAVSEPDFDRVIDWQADQEGRAYRTYDEIMATSLEQTLGLQRAKAGRVAAGLGHWPLFADSRDGMRELMEIAPCIAMTNSDRAHRKPIEGQLGFAMSDWVCAEEIQVYKPSAFFWEAVGARRGRGFGPDWWHVSAYADYDLEVAWALGLTCIFIARPHHRPGRHHHRAASLTELAAQIRRGSLDYLSVA